MRKLLLLLACFGVNAYAGPATMFGLPYDGTVNENAVHVNSSGQLTITQISGEDETLDRLATYDSGSPKNMTATGAVKAEAGVLIGVFVSASTTCTITLHDNASAGSGTVVLATTAAITAPAYFPIPAQFGNGLYFTEGGTCDVTFYYL